MSHDDIEIQCGRAMSRINEFKEYVNNPLWEILVETVHSLVMYAHHKAYVRDVVFSENPEIKPEELAARLGIPLGEALVILYELEHARNEGSTTREQLKP